MSYILDTNIVTAILKQDRQVAKQLRLVETRRQALFISCITYYEGCCISIRLGNFLFLTGFVARLQLLS